MFRSKAPTFLIMFAAFMSAAAVTTYALTYTQRSATHFRSLTATESSQEIEDMIRVRGADAAWKFLKTTYIKDDKVLLGVNDPHTLAHDVGEGFFRENGINGISKCDETFTGGCYHGVVAELVTEGMGDAKSVGELCLRQRDPQSCAHGAGHGISEFSAEDLPATLGQCDLFPKEISKDCAEGALMDSSWDWNNSDIEAHPWLVCGSVADDYKIVCASAIGNYFSEYQDWHVPDVRKYDARAISEVCSEAPTADMMKICYLRLDQSIARRAATGVSIEDQCALTGPDHAAECITAATQFSHQVVR